MRDDPEGGPRGYTRGVDSQRLDVSEILDSFQGSARLFPLPHLVLFPDAIAPLRIFEKRYIAMFEEAIEDDLLIATALIRPEAIPLGLENPPLHSVVCLGRILRHKRLVTGQYEFLLYGLSRAEIEEEIPSEPFRRARLRLLPDYLAPEDRVEVARQLRRGIDLVPGRRSMVWNIRNVSNVIRGIDADPGRYADALADASDLGPELRYALLAEVDVRQRFELLIKSMEEIAYADDPPVPPGTDPRLN